MEIDTTGITVDKRQGASVTYYDAYVTPQLRVESWYTTANYGNETAVKVQILDRRGGAQDAVVFKVHTEEHPREVTRQIAALLTKLEEA